MRRVLPMAVIVAACSGGGGPGSGSSSGTPQIPVDPNTGRWFGTIAIDAHVAVDKTETVASATQHKRQHQQWFVLVNIDETGVRTTHLDWDLDDFQHTIIDAPCAQQDGVSITRAEGSAENPSTGFSGYFQLLGDGANGYRSGETFGVAQDTSVMAETKNRLVTTTCDGSFSDTSARSAIAPMMLKLPFDRIKGAFLDDGRTALGGDAFADAAANTSYEMFWALKRDKEVVAKVGGPYRVTRASRVTLDASKSRGDITSYRWTVTPSDACKKLGFPEIAEKLSVGEEVHHDGKTFEFTVLCPVKVKLVVRGPSGEDEDTGFVTVSPRKWQLGFPTAVVSESAFAAGQGGTNHCSVEGLAETGHTIHRDDFAYTNEVTRTQVQDDGPFKNAFYVASQQLAVRRIEYVNTQWKSGGTVYTENVAQNNAAVASRLAGQASAHEAAHTSLMKAYRDSVAGSSRDPAFAIESLAAMDPSSLELHLKTAIDSADLELCKAGGHRFVHDRLIKNGYGDVVRIYLPGGNPYVEGVFGALGNETLYCED